MTASYGVSEDTSAPISRPIVEALANFTLRAFLLEGNEVDDRKFRNLTKPVVQDFPARFSDNQLITDGISMNLQ